MRIRRPLASIAALLAIALVAPTASFAEGDNLLPNPGFEDSPSDPVGDTIRQPLLPTGWAFEGSTALFDHSQNDRRSGKRMIAISGSYSGKRKVCAGNADPEIPETCVNNPATSVIEDDAATYYTVPPAWRTVSPVAVTAGARYTLRVWSSGDAITSGEGARTRVRWLNANGVPIGSSDGPAKSASQAAPSWGWTKLERTNITAPAGAASAIILLGYSMDTWLGQVRYDDAFFGRT